MSEIGYYRYKTTADTVKTVNFVVNYAVAASKRVIPIDVCSGYRLIKFLDSKGQYRFFPFNQYYDIKDNPTLIGTTNKFITSLLTGQTNRQNIGYKNERKMTLTGEATTEQLELLSDIWTSPRVYLYIGSNNSDQLKDWLEVSIDSSDNIVRRKKATIGKIEIKVTLPEHFTIKMI